MFCDRFRGEMRREGAEDVVRFGEEVAEIDDDDDGKCEDVDTLKMRWCLGSTYWRRVHFQTCDVEYGSELEDFFVLFEKLQSHRRTHQS